MDSTSLNALQNSSSAYLRSAMHQPVRWHEWGEEAFARAAAEDKPILLDIGAVWCHWCHVMDRESYENAELAAYLNEHYVAVKVDRDERPDVDTRYQAAVSAISGQGGWPLTAFLTPNGQPFFGGTYFPPEERMGRPSFRRVLETMAGAFRHKRDEVDESAASVLQAIEYNEAFSGGSTGLEQSSAGIALIDKLVESALKSFDPRNGGFGSQPKFPHPAALDMLVDAASRAGANHEKAAEAALTTLHRMFQGGIFDQLAGGFHRYSVDERWVVPHFEKMSYDNSELLRSYVHAFQTFVDPACAEAANEVLRWMQEWLSDLERGGFYASQDADISLDDDGDYFTWTRREAEAILLPEELAVTEIYYDIGAVGDMNHDPARNVLFRPFTMDEVAARTSRDEAAVRNLISSAKGKLLAERLKRKTPFVDKSMYTGWNAMCISAFVEAGRVFQNREVIGFALKSLDRVLREAWNGTELLHVVAYGDSQAPRSRVRGVLEDYVFLGEACLTAWETSGNPAYFLAAQALTDTIVERFADNEKGGFFDTDPSAGPQFGALATHRKPLQDAPTPAGNPAAASLLLRMHALTDKAEYREKALATLECFAGIVEHFGLYAATFALALGRLVRPAVQVVIVASDDEPSQAIAMQLEVVALARYAVNKSVIRLKASQLAGLPSALAQTLPNLPATQGALALVCSGNTCQPPVHSAEDLIDVLNSSL